MLRLIIVTLGLFFILFNSIYAQDEFGKIELGLGASFNKYSPHFKIEYQATDKSSILFFSQINKDRIPDQVIGIDSIITQDSIFYFDKFSFVDDYFIRLGLNYRLYTSLKKDYRGTGFFLELGLGTYIHFGGTSEYNSVLNIPFTINWGLGYKFAIKERFGIEFLFRGERSQRKSFNNYINEEGFVDLRLVYNLGKRMNRNF